MINKRLIKESKLKQAYMPVNILHPVFNSITTILNAYFLALIVNEVFIKKQSLKDVHLYLLLLILNAAFKFLFNFFMDRLIKNLSEDIKENIKLKTFNLIVSANAHKVQEQKSGELINILTEGSEMLTPYYSQYIPQFFASVLIPVILCGFVAFKDGLSALIMLITYPIIPFFMALIGNKSKEKNEQQWKKLTTLSSHFLDVLQGFSTLKVFGRSKIQGEKVYEISESYRKSIMEVLKVSFLSALVLELSATISTAVIAVNLGLRLVYNRIDFLTAFFILVITPEFYIPLRQLGVKYHASLNGQVAIEKISFLENNLKAETASGESFSQIDKVEAIEVKKLSFSHRYDETLNNLCFAINKHEKLALVGESGSGKSTLINILSRFLKPEDNMVFVNNIDINYIERTNYLSKIAIIPQFPHIFNMSIEDNIMLGSSISESAFIDICRLTKIEDFAQKFDKKYKTVIGQGEEVSISGGERQRIALARVLVKNADVVIMDEPTSALDAETEEIITEVIDSHLQNKIVIIAAHRLNTVKSADRIIVLENGSIIETGSHKDLIEKRGRYYKMLHTSEVLQ